MKLKNLIISTLVAISGGIAYSIYLNSLFGSAHSPLDQEYKMNCTTVWETEYTRITRCENQEVICYKLNRNALQCKFK